MSIELLAEKIKQLSDEVRALRTQMDRLLRMFDADLDAELGDEIED